MSFGMRIWGATGALELDENSFTVRVVYSGLVSRGPPNGSGARNTVISIPGVRPATHSAVCIPVGAYPQDPSAQNSYAVQFEPQVIDDGVIVWFGNRAHPSAWPVALGTQRVLVMKDR